MQSYNNQQTQFFMLKLQHSQKIIPLEEDQYCLENISKLKLNLTVASSKTIMPIMEESFMYNILELSTLVIPWHFKTLQCMADLALLIMMDLLH